MRAARKQSGLLARGDAAKSRCRGMACRDERQHCGSCQVLAKAKGNGPFAAIACLPGAAALCTVRLQGCNVLAWWLEKKAMRPLGLACQACMPAKRQAHAVTGRDGDICGYGLCRSVADIGRLRNFPALSFCLCLLGACSQSLHVRASATNGGVATHPAARVARCGKGCNKEHAHWLPCPRVALQKQHLPCCQYLPGRQPVFCFVLRALRLAATAFAQQGTRYEAFEQTLTPCGAAATA